MTADTLSYARADAKPAADAPIETLTLAVENMHCGGCLRSVERAVSSLPGVRSARANLTAKRVSIRYDPACCGEADMIAALDRAGFHAAPMQAAPAGQATARDKDLLRRAAIAGFAAANIMLLSVSVWSGAAGDMDPAVQSLFHWLSALIALPTVAYSGQPFFASAAQALRGRRLNMDVPISLAILLATGMSFYQTLLGGEQVYFDAAVTLLFFLLIGRWLDERLRVRARGEAQNLLCLQSGLAMLIDAKGTQRSVPAHALVAGDRVLVAAGERIPADGALLTGPAEIDQSLITGESAPVMVGEAGELYAGTLNLGQPLELRVTAADDSTLLAEIGRLMAAAEQGRARYRRLADRAAQIYAPAVHILGAATFLLWLALGASWQTALTCAIAVLIITCPCALALAVPAVQIAAANRLFRRGVILKAPDGLERLAEADMIVFDKTGTITLGRPQLVDDAAIPDDALAAAAGLAAASRHPYARAIVQAAMRRLGNVAPAPGVEESPGRGLVRRTGQGEERLGSARWCGLGPDEAGGSVWYKPAKGAAVRLPMTDALRPDSAAVVRSLKGQGFKVSLLSGDGAAAVQKAARETGIDAWLSQVTPTEKIAWVKTQTREGRKVLMVGDGLNDAPALAAAHASISPASAADISQRTADLVFQGDLLAPLLEAIATARRARFMSLQNFAVALLYNAICVPLAMGGLVTPLIAALAMSTSSIAVTANALRLAGSGARL